MEAAEGVAVAAGGLARCLAVWAAGGAEAAVLAAAPVDLADSVEAAAEAAERPEAGRFRAIHAGRNGRHT